MGPSEWGGTILRVRVRRYVRQCASKLYIQVEEIIVVCSFEGRIGMEVQAQRHVAFLLRNVSIPKVG